MHFVLSSSFPPEVLNLLVFQENPNPYVLNLLSQSHLHVVGKSLLMPMKTDEQFLWPLEPLFFQEARCALPVWMALLLQPSGNFLKGGKRES